MKHLVKSAKGVKGLSLSQAQSISNSCNQRMMEIDRKIENLNNCSKTLEFNGKEMVFQNANPVPSDFVELVIKKGKYSALLAFLRENIKYKDELIFSTQRKQFQYEGDAPVMGELEHFTSKPLHPLTDKPDATWGWSKLTNKELAEYWEAEAMAAQIGNVIHKDRTLDKLRKELVVIEPLTFHNPNKSSSTNAVMYPVISKIHHTPENLLQIHEELASRHREYEQKVNSFKARIKSMATEENAKISEENAKKQAEVNQKNSKVREKYSSDIAEYDSKVKEETFTFEKTRQEKIKEYVSLKIDIIPMFQSTIDEFLKDVKE